MPLVCREGLDVEAESEETYAGEFNTRYYHTDDTTLCDHGLEVAPSISGPSLPNFQLKLEEAEQDLKPEIEHLEAVQKAVKEMRKQKREPPGVQSQISGPCIAAFDIETVNLDIDAGKNRILSIALAATDISAPVSWAFGGDDGEERTIRSFLAFVLDHHYEGILAWNSDKFDLPVLQMRMEALGIGSLADTFPPILDCLRAHKQMLRKSETKFQLDFIAKRYLHEGKLDFDPTKTLEYFEKNPDALRRYNEHDAELVLKLNVVMGYWETFKAIYEESRCKNAKWQYDIRRFAARSENKLDNGFVWWRPIMGLIQRYCERNEIDNPFDWPNEAEKAENKDLIRQDRPGGYVMPPETGHHENVIELDFSSLYPSLLISANMGRDKAHPKRHSDIHAPFCDYESPKWGRSVIAGTLVELREERQAVKTKLAEAKAHGASKEEMSALKGRTEALKILLNSFYGQLYAPFSPLFHFDSARNITTLGQECVKLMIRSMPEFGDGVKAVAGDTDSTYVKVPEEKFTPEFAQKLSDSLTEKVRKSLSLEDRGMEYIGTFDLKGLYSHFEIYKKKRYAKLELGKPVSEMDVIGYERGDVPELQVDLQKEIFRRHFTGGDVNAAIREARERLRADHILVLRWRRGQTSAEGRALTSLVNNGLPPIPGDAVGFLILGRGTIKSPEHRIHARRLDGETVEWIDVRSSDNSVIRQRSQSKTFLTDKEEEQVWQTILENLDGVRTEPSSRQSELV